MTYLKMTNLLSITTALTLTHLLFTQGVSAESPQGLQQNREKQFQAEVKSDNVKRPTLKTSSKRTHEKHVPRILNLNFVHEPEQGTAKGVVGKLADHWNFVEYGQPLIHNLLFADGTESDVEVVITENDGEWGIAGQSGIFHGYIYHNCQCVDLSVTFNSLPCGIYEVYVFAHGDAPDQNAAIEIESNGVKLTGKSTLNDKTWKFRSEAFEEGNQYVRYLVEVADGAPVKITSKRDGSNYSMFNAIQLRRMN